jgi:hypothetical protein
VAGFDMFYCTLIFSKSRKMQIKLKIKHYDFAAGRWFFPDTAVSSINKFDCHDIAEILLKVALNTITPILTPTYKT